jgi:hypothetical protein
VTTEISSLMSICTLLSRRRDPWGFRPPRRPGTPTSLSGPGTSPDSWRGVSPHLRYHIFFATVNGVAVELVAELQGSTVIVCSGLSILVNFIHDFFVKMRIVEIH